MTRISNKIIERVKQKDEEAFAEIFYTYRNYVYAIAKYKLKDEEDAKDCVQEIFQKLFFNIVKYDSPRNNFHAWFIQLVNNHIIDFYRKRKHSKVILDDDYISNCKCEENKSNLLEELVDVLLPLEYEIISYRMVYDMTFIEIAEVMNMNRETVRRIYLKAISKAKDYVERKKGYEG